jgi:hypothetical protein
MSPRSLHRFALLLWIAGCGGTPISAPAPADGGLPDVAADGLPDVAADGPAPADLAAAELPGERDTSPADLLPDVAIAPDQPDALLAVPDVGLDPAPGSVCILNSDCEDPLACIFGRCHAPCRESKDCAGGQRCVIGSVGYQVCLLPQEDACVLNADCPAPLACGADRRCRSQCQDSVDCPSGDACIDHLCAASASGPSDGGLPEPADAGKRDGAVLWGLTSGKNAFLVTSVSAVEDGCAVVPAASVGLRYPLTYDRATARVGIGDMLGMPPMHSLGVGQVLGNQGTLTRYNARGDGFCNWEERLVGRFELTGHDEFTLAVTMEKAGIAPGCMPKPPSDPCTSRWTWTFVRR